MTESSEISLRSWHVFFSCSSINGIPVKHPITSDANVLLKFSSGSSNIISDEQSTNQIVGLKRGLADRHNEVVVVVIFYLCHFKIWFTITIITSRTL
jgi:hypothetical protein